MNELYGGVDPRNIPAYSINQVSRYLQIPKAMIRSWISGGENALIQISDRSSDLSFINLVEAHVLRAITQHHTIHLEQAKFALKFVEQQLKVSSVLSQETFLTSGASLFIEQYCVLIKTGELTRESLKKCFKFYLNRIQYDSTRSAVKLYLFTGTSEEDSPRMISADSRISFGRFVIDGTGIPTSILAERYKAGESINELAHDYEVARLKIEKAIRFEMLTA